MSKMSYNILILALVGMVFFQNRIIVGYEGVTDGLNSALDNLANACGLSFRHESH